MKRLLLNIVLLAFCCTLVTFSAAEAISTGDQGLDQELEFLNDAVRANMGNFSMDLGRHYGVPEVTVDMLLHTAGMSPADVYMAVKIWKVSSRPFDIIIKEYKGNKGKGWGVIAKNLGIKPGSREFHWLKQDDSGMLGMARGKGHKEKGNKDNKGKDKNQKANKK